MSDEDAFIQSILSNPSEVVARQVFADWLEERGDPRAELLRLTHALTQDTDLPNRLVMEERQRELLSRGVKPIESFCTLPIAETAEMTFSCIPPGTFLMGSKTEAGSRLDEFQHRVTLTKGFFIGIYPVTQGQWEAVMGTNPSVFSRPGHGPDTVDGLFHHADFTPDYFTDEELSWFPVEFVSWREAKAYCKKISEFTAKTIRLPSEAEWEYACRAGTSSAYYFNRRNELNGSEVNCNFGDSRADGVRPKRRTTKVGEYATTAPHPWGLCDMHGNLWEWCEDWYGAVQRLDDGYRSGSIS